MKSSFDLEKIIKHESFIVCPFLTTNQFISYCKDRSIRTSEKQLERFEQLGLFFPIARVQFPKIKIKIEINPELNQQKYFGVLQEGEEWNGDIKEEYARFSWEKDYAKAWLKDGFLWEPSSRKFQKWKNFRDKEKHLRIESYYSIFQCYTLYNLKKSTEIIACAESWFCYDDEALNKVAKRTSELSKELVNSLKETGVRGKEAPELCQFLSNRFFPETQTDRRNIQLSIPISIPNFRHRKWNWDDYCNNWGANSLLEDLNLRSDEIQSIHDRLSLDVQWIDPLVDWYELVSFVALDQKKKLKGTALLAQTIYSMEHMLRLFHRELTGEKLFRPNESHNWHPDKYFGEGVSENNLRHLEFLSNQYHLNPRPNLILVVEGDGEEEQFPRLAKELFGYSFSTLGIEIMNAQGIGGFTGKKTVDKYGALEKYIDDYHNRQTIVFVVLDDEGKGLAKKVRNKLIKAPSKYNQNRMVTKPEYIHLWKNKTIEFENFSHDEIAQALSEISKGIYTFSSNEIRECENQSKVNESDYLSNLFKEKTKFRLPKLVLLNILFGYIIRNGGNEFDDKNVPARPVVKILQEVIKLASWNYQPTCHDTWEKNQKSGYFGDIKQ